MNELQLRIQLKVEQKKNSLLEKKLKKLQKNSQTNIKKKVKYILKNVFTPKQIYKVQNPDKRVKWTVEDIALGVELRSLSKNTYRFLKKINYPLPGLSTLSNRVIRLRLKEGLLTEVLTFMKYKAKSLLDYKKLVILSFYEIDISYKAYISTNTEQETQKCQFGTCRSLFDDWKQLIYYNCNRPLNSMIIKDIIKKLYEVGYTVVAITHNLNAFHSKTWKKLKVGVGVGLNCYFTHPSDKNLKVFVFVDGHHLLKLMRNHFLDNGFLINHTLICKDIIEKMLQVHDTDLQVILDLTKADLLVNNQERQKLSSATKLFSPKTARAIELCGQKNYLNGTDSWNTTAEIFKLIHCWFNLFNSKNKDDFDPAKAPFGLNLVYQNDVLNKMANFMSEIILQSSDDSTSFKKNIILSNESLKQLFPYLQEKYTTTQFSVTHILTHKLTLDYLEGLATFLQTEGIFNAHPPAFNFQFRIRSYILGKYLFDPSCTFSSEVHSEKNLISFITSEEALLDVTSNTVENSPVDMLPCGTPLPPLTSEKLESLESLEDLEKLEDLEELKEFEELKDLTSDFQAHDSMSIDVNDFNSGTDLWVN